LLKTNIDSYRARSKHRLLEDIDASPPRGLAELVPETLMIILLIAAMLAVVGYVARLIQTKPIKYFAYGSTKSKISALYSKLGPARH